MPTPDLPIYFDYNGTTPVDPEVTDALLPYLRQHFGNPSSGHIYGRKARQAVERARDQVAFLLGCSAQEILFTSGGTEANNIAILGPALVMTGRERSRCRLERPDQAGRIGICENV